MSDNSIEDVRKLISNEIVRCFNCCPYDCGEPVWLGPNIDMQDLLYEFDVEEIQYSEILEEFKCPNCGAELDEMAIVEIKSAYDKKVDAFFEALNDPKHTKLLHEFNEYVSKYPLLALNHSVGQELYNSISECTIANSFEITYENKWFRARLLNDESRIFSSMEMWAPDPQRVYIKEGRYNHAGQAFLYLADDDETAYDEVKRNDKSVCVIQEFNINELNQILDLRKDERDLDLNDSFLKLAIIYNNYISQEAYGLSWKPEYFVPRFIADIAREKGYKGIIFNSIAGYGLNLVLFEYSKDHIQVVEEPKLCIKSSFDKNLPHFLSGHPD